MKLTLPKRYQLKKDVPDEKERKNPGYEWCDIILHAMFDATLGAALFLLFWLLFQPEFFGWIKHEILSFIK